MKKRVRLLSLIAFVVSFFGATSVLGWAENGHRITAEIAERNLSPKAEAAVRAILGEELLAEIATWPDDIRSDKSWEFAKPWHFCSIDDDESFDDYQPSLKGDVIQQLKKFERFLRDPSATTLEAEGKSIDKRQALAFYVHLVGDLHQPLHVGRRDDLGGNKILVEWFNDEVNLHSVWDEHLIESRNLSYTEFSTFLNRVSEEDTKEWQSAGYLVWAKESKAVRDQVYDFGEQTRPQYPDTGTVLPVLGYEYRSRSLPIIRDRLAKGGIRLAGKLNDIFEDHPDVPLGESGP